MRAFEKLLDKRASALVGYDIGRALARRTEWMDRARNTKYPECRSHAVKVARDNNRDLVRALRAL